MGLIGALPDRARTVREVDTGEKVDGRKIKSTVKGPWFRCRVESNEGRQDVQPGQVIFRKRTNFMAFKRAVDGTLTDVRGDDTLEVESREFGNGEWRFDGDPRFVRKKRVISHIEGTIVKVEDKRSGNAS